MGQLRNPVSVTERPQHAEAAATADISCYRKRHPSSIRSSYIEKSAAEMEVGGRAECRRRARLSHASTIGLVEMDAVCIYRALAEQSISVVHVEIATGLRK